MQGQPPTSPSVPAAHTRTPGGAVVHQLCWLLSVSSLPGCHTGHLRSTVVSHPLLVSPGSLATYWKYQCILSLGPFLCLSLKTLARVGGQCVHPSPTSRGTDVTVLQRLSYLRCRKDGNSRACRVGSLGFRHARKVWKVPPWHLSSGGI